MRHPSLDQVGALTIRSVLAICACALGCVSIFGSDPAAPRSRAARFDRFCGELHLEWIDTSGLTERIRLGAAHTGADPAVDEPQGGRGRVGFVWGAADRIEARRATVRAAIGRLESEFAASRFTDPRRASASRAIEVSLRRSIGLPDDAPPLVVAEATLAAVRPSPWSSPAFSAPAALAGDFSAHTNGDIDTWQAHLTELPASIADLRDQIAAGALDESYGGRARVIARALLDDMARLEPSVGTGRRADPLLGPYIAARQRILGESRLEALRAVPGSLSEDLRSAYGELGAALRAAYRQLDAERGRQTVVPLRGARRGRWLLRLTDAAGDRAGPISLEALAREELVRLGIAVRDALEQSGAEDPDAALEAIQSGATDGPSIAKSPEELWRVAKNELPALVELPEGASVLVEARTASPFERPRGRWTPWVPGDLRRSPSDGDLAPPIKYATYLAPRAADAMTPGWLRNADALRYGIPGHAVVDAYRRGAAQLPLYIRAREHPAFTEGWSLYALGRMVTEGILRQDERFGVLAQEQIAFAALLIDVGLHERGWSLDQAVSTVMELTPLGRLPARELVLRAIAFPGRGALPAIGLLRIRSLRRETEARLGERFDARAFHGALLNGGPLPIAELDRRVERWIEDVEEQ